MAYRLAFSVLDLMILQSEVKMVVEMVDQFSCGHLLRLDCKLLSEKLDDPSDRCISGFTAA